MKRFLLIAATMFAALSLSAQNPLPNDPAVRVGKLENGLTYYIRHNDKPAQRCEFYLATNAGALNEGPGQDGLAHFLEHMCFNGLKNLPGKQMLEYLQSIGASFGGNINASTGVETTQYMLNNIPVIREGIIDTCLLVMHDYSHFVLNEPEEIDAERGVILEEKRTRNNANWRLFEQSLPYYYGDTKYAVTNIIGSEENLKTFKPETLVDFYQTWYRPDKQAVIVVGDIDVDQIEAKIKALFADIPAPVDPKEMEPIVIADNEEPVVGIITDAELAENECQFLWRRPSIPEIYNNTDQVFFLNLVNDLFEMVMSERFNDITSKPGAPFATAALGSGRLIETCDALFGNVSFKNGQDVEAIKAFLYEVEKVKRYGVTEPELQRAKDNLLSSYEKAVAGADSRKNPSFVYPLIRNFFDNVPFLEPSTRYELAKMLCQQINAALVNQIVPQYITDKNMVAVISGPSSVEHPSKDEVLALIYASREAEVEAPVVETSDVELLDAASLKASKVKKTSAGIAGSTEWILKNGVKVVVLPTDYKKDEVSIKLSLPGGYSLVSDEELYSFEDNIWGLFEQNSGVGKFTRTELNKVLSGKMVSCSPYFDEDRHGISVSTTPKDLETALQLLYLTFTAARFDEDAFQVAYDQIKAVLPNMETNPMFQFQKRLPADIYEPTARRFSISEEVLEKASLENMEKVYKRLFKDAAGAVVYVVGNVDLETLKPMVETYVGALPKGKKAASIEDDGVRFRSGVLEDHFTTPMTTPKVTVFQVYNAALPASVENQLTLQAVSYILDMIYTDTLREEEGGTYGAQSASAFFRYPVETALLQVYFDTNEAQADKLATIARKAVADLAENGPSEEYFNRTVENMKNNLPQSRITNSYWMNVLNLWQNYGIEADTEREAAINALTREKVAAMARQILNSGNFVEIRMMPQAE